MKIETNADVNEVVINGIRYVKAEKRIPIPKEKIILQVSENGGVSIVSIKRDTKVKFITPEGQGFDLKQMLDNLKTGDIVSIQFESYKEEK